jgi:hypothetical protein
MFDRTAAFSILSKAVNWYRALISLSICFSGSVASDGILGWLLSLAQWSPEAMDTRTTTEAETWPRAADREPPETTHVPPATLYAELGTPAGETLKGRLTAGTRNAHETRPRQLCELCRQLKHAVEMGVSDPRGTVTRSLPAVPVRRLLRQSAQEDRPQFERRKTTLGSLCPLASDSLVFIDLLGSM